MAGILKSLFHPASFSQIKQTFYMISGSKGQKAVRACTIRRLNLGPAKHEEVAIYAVNLRIPNV